MESTSAGPADLGSELHSDVNKVADSAKQRLHSEVDSRKSGAAGQARMLSSALSRASEELGQNSPSWLRSAFDGVSQAVERIADTVDRKDSRELTRDVQEIARQHPGSFLAACAFAGFAAARVMQAGVHGSGTASSPGLAERHGSEPSIQPPAFPLTSGAEPFVTQSADAGGAL
jgi:hypothetical protein